MFNPGAGSTLWDPQNTAYGMLFQNKISPDLGRANLQRVSDYVNRSGTFANPHAGQAMGGVAGAESSGNPFATNPKSGAAGMFQWMGGRAGHAQGSPEDQARAAMGEITGGGYGPTDRALNDPSLSMAQMQGPLIGNFEGLSGSPGQMAGDVARARMYGTTLNSLPIDMAGAA